MAEALWLIVAKSAHVRSEKDPATWWCFPFSAAVGDRVLLYCPAGADRVRQGVFAEAEISEAPSRTSDRNCNCRLFSGGKLGYAAIKVVRRFGTPLTASMMKADPAFESMSVVRRNFQGTTFRLSQLEYSMIRERLELMETQS